MVIVASTIIKTEFSDFKVCYHNTRYGGCVSFSKGNLSKNAPIVRLHSACLFGEVFYSHHCDCGHQIKKTMRLIQKEGTGVIIYAYEEGRGIGLKEKIKAMEVQRIKKIDTVEAFKKLGLKRSDYRTFKAEVEALKDLKLSKNIKTYSGNPKKLESLRKAGYNIKRLLKYELKHINKLAKEEIKTKEEKMGYFN